MITRNVIPELLDHLAPDNPEAMRSRRDLRRINFLMGNESWICKTLRPFRRLADRGITEIGAGDGHLINRLTTLFPEVSIQAYDLAPRPETLDVRVRWNQGDVFKAKKSDASGILVANLFLHHFQEEALGELGKWFEDFDLLVFNEPDRARLPHILGWGLHPWINRVTQHDMHVSINAGFAEGEIPRFLKLDAFRWQIRETCTWRGGRHVLAWRR